MTVGVVQIVPWIPPAVDMEAGIHMTIIVAAIQDMPALIVQKERLMSVAAMVSGTDLRQLVPVKADGMDQIVHQTIPIQSAVTMVSGGVLLVYVI